LHFAPLSHIQRKRKIKHFVFFPTAADESVPAYRQAGKFANEVSARNFLRLWGACRFRKFSERIVNLSIQQIRSQFLFVTFFLGKKKVKIDLRKKKSGEMFWKKKNGKIRFFDFAQNDKEDLDSGLRTGMTMQ
jgi:hypothetical protein